MANKIKFGLSRVFVATVSTVSTSGQLTYSSPVAIPGSVSLSLTAEGDSSSFFADNVRYWTMDVNNGYSGDLEVALIPDAIRSAILGETLDAKGFYVEKSSDKQTEFALLFQFEGDENATKYVLYNCKMARPDIESATTEDGIEVQTVSGEITASPRAFDNIVKAQCASTASSAYTNWFSAVQD